MDQDQLEQAYEILGQLQRLDFVSIRIANTLDLVASRLDLCRSALRCDEDLDDDTLVEPSVTEFQYWMWHIAIEAAQLLIIQAEEETRSRPGCLPLDPLGCELMSLAFSLRWTVMGGYWLYGAKLARMK